VLFPEPVAPITATKVPAPIDTLTPSIAVIDLPLVGKIL
jgi:hypothetical protein